MVTCAGSTPGIGIINGEVNWIVTVEAGLPSVLLSTDVVSEIGLGLVQVVDPERLMLLVN
jgi:hypothetical protein